MISISRKEKIEHQPQRVVSSYNCSYYLELENDARGIVFTPFKDGVRSASGITVNLDQLLRAIANTKPEEVEITF